MQISKPFLLLCALTVATLPFAARGADPGTPPKTPARPLDDSDVQAKARAALREQLNQPAPPASAATNAPVAKPKKVKPAPAPTPVKTPPPVAQPAAPVAQPSTPATRPVTPPEAAVQPAPVAKTPPPPKKKETKPAKVKQAATPPVAQTTAAPRPRADPEAIAKAREAMREKMGTITANEPSTPPAVAKPERPKKVKPEPQPKVAKPAEPVKRSPQPEPAVTATTPGTSPSIQPVPDSTETAAQPVTAAPVPNPPKEPKQKKSKEKQTAVKAAPNFQPIQGPASPLGSDKKQRLSELLRKYQADELTPEQYHQQRAKILSEP